MRVVLDTHMWLWWLLPNSELTDEERASLDQVAAGRGMFLPAICQWEAQMLHSKKRIVLPVPFSTWLRSATASNVLTVLPLSADAVIEVDQLPTSFHGDPADRMIVATARCYGLPLATNDYAIRKSRLAKIWKP